MSLNKITDAASGLAWYTFTGEPLPMPPKFVHAMVTRLGGASTGTFAGLNLGGTVGDSPEAVATNHRRLYKALGIRQDQVVSPHQVHGNRVARVTRQDGDTVIPATDALITDAPDVALLLRFADCAPVLFYDPVHHAAGLAHAGWRGVAAEIAPATVAAMAAEFSTDPETLWAGVGPCIGLDHYTVGEEVVTAIQSTLPAGIRVAEAIENAWKIDLAAALRSQLHQVGVRRVALAGICTACHVAEWYSHRGEDGHAGRFGVVVMLR